MSKYYELIDDSEYMNILNNSNIISRNVMDDKWTFIMDLDGVLTVGCFLYDANGKAYKTFGPDDADALKLIKDKVNLVFVSADHRGFPISTKRFSLINFLSSSFVIGFGKILCFVSHSRQRRALMVIGFPQS